MRRRTKCLIVLSLPLFCEIPLSAVAQTTTSDIVDVLYPTTFQSKDQNGVDLVSGRMDTTSIALSTGLPPLYIERRGLGERGTLFFPDQDSTDISIKAVATISTSGVENDYYEVSGQGARSWYNDDPELSSVYPDGAKLEYDSVASQLVYTDHTGNVWKYAAAAGGCHPLAGTNPTYCPKYLTSLTQPNGRVVNYYPNGSQYDNLGNALKYVYTNSTSSAVIYGITAFNLAYDTNTCDLSAMANACVFAKTWPAFTYVGTANGINITDANYGVTVTNSAPLGTCTTGPTGLCLYSFTITSPTSQITSLIKDSLHRVTSLTRDGRNWTYSYSDTQYDVQGSHPYYPYVGHFHTVTVTDPDGSTMSVVSNTGNGTVTSVTDGLGRTTTYTYAHSTFNLESVTFPEGDKRVYAYDGRGNITEADVVPKPGSGLPTYSAFAGYDATCVYWTKCNKPNWVKDQAGHQTDYTYDTTHGGVLTVSQPPDANGLRPVKRFSYTLRKAWLANGGSGYVQSSSGVYLLASEKTCRLTTTNIATDSCAGGSSDEIVITYDYGPDSGPNNLWPRGKVVTADGTSRRTCYGYDQVGNKISETGPRAGLAGCP